MPEIAEVETVKNVLKNKILHKKIIDIEIIYPKIIKSNLNEFKNLINQEFIDIKRRGKWLLFETTNNYLLTHLNMEGKFYIKNKDEVIEKHEHIIFIFEDLVTLRYRDTRKFGKMILINKDELDSVKELKKLGIDAIDDKLTKEYLYESLHKKNKRIKELLLNQDIICGLGNIYVNEILFASGISPLRKGKDISVLECDSIVKNTKEIINKAIEYGGTTIRSYTSSLGVKGTYQQFLQVHGKENYPCPRCGKFIENIKINDRSSYYCPNCQK